MRVDEVNEEMGLGLPEGDYETVAGFVLHLLHRIPKQGDSQVPRSEDRHHQDERGEDRSEVLVTKEKERVANEAGGADVGSASQGRISFTEDRA